MIYLFIGHNKVEKYICFPNDGWKIKEGPG
jgi:hypothetical protein